MIHRLIAHFRGNVVGYIALFVAILGGGGSYAVAASNHATRKKHKTPTTLVACASKKSGEMFLHTGKKKCARGRHKVKWSIKGPKGARGKAGAPGATGPAGAPSPSVFATVDATYNPPILNPAKGITVQEAGTGVFLATITDATCAKGINVPVVTPTSVSDAILPANATPVAYVSNPSVTQFTIHVGYVNGGSFTPANLEFNVMDTCQPSGSPAARR